MTTIVYRDGVIAYDSRLTSGGLITTDAAEKSRQAQGYRFFLCGPTCDIDAFIGWFFGVKPESVPDVSAMVLTPDGSLLLSSCNKEEGIWRTPVELDRPYAIGSGSPYAWGAMDMGADAIQAVKIAAGRDTGTGGRVRAYRLRSAA